ncbi:MAG: hypothetical protein FJ054_03690 [Cyanobacteria bacterium M_surface_10_m2_119]|jgi:hypothetical protein|nr:hypothetical protein [Cyanobacteria bacterium M_surface_10_m2_119]
MGNPASPWSVLSRLALLASLALGLGACNLNAMQEVMRQGHAATIDCLQGERAITDGDELRCEDWRYVRENYLERSKTPQKP